MEVDSSFDHPLDAAGGKRNAIHQEQTPLIISEKRQQATKERLSPSEVPNPYLTT